MKAYVKDNKYTFTVLPKAGSIVNTYQVRGYPSLYYIDKNGNIVGSDLGFPGQEAVEAKVQKLLK